VQHFAELFIASVLLAGLYAAMAFGLGLIYGVLRIVNLAHGGVIMALADSTGGACAFLNLPEGAAGTTTIESKTNFLRAVRAGHIESASRPLHAGRTVVVIETDVVDADGRLVARVTQSQAVLRPA